MPYSNLKNIQNVPCGPNYLVVQFTHICFQSHCVLRLRESCMTMLSVLVEAPRAPRMTMPPDDKMCNLLSILAALREVL